MEDDSRRLASFWKIASGAIVCEGFDKYQPIVIYPVRHHQLVLEGTPAVGDLEAVCLAWARSNAIGDEEFLLAFRVSPTEIKIIHRNGLQLDAKAFTV
jgi:hypothetical protein